MNGKTIPDIKPSVHLTTAELERFAYIQGNSLLAVCAAEADDLEEQVDGFDTLVDAAKQDAFESGKLEGLGLDAAQQIADLKNELTDLKASHQRCRNNLQAVYDWLRSDDCKTAKSRQVFEKRLLAALHVTPRF